MKDYCKSPMEMLDLYFESISCKNKRKIGNKELVIDHNIEHSMNESKESEQKEHTVKIYFRIFAVDNSFELNIVAVGVFKITDILDSETEKFIIYKNTIAVMLPYIRSQVVLMTAQPGMIPVQLPLFNVEEFIDKAVSKESKYKKEDFKANLKK